MMKYCIFINNSKFPLMVSSSLNDIKVCWASFMESTFHSSGYSEKDKFYKNPHFHFAQLTTIELESLMREYEKEKKNDATKQERNSNPSLIAREGENNGRTKGSFESQR